MKRAKSYVLVVVGIMVVFLEGCTEKNTMDYSGIPIQNVDELFVEPELDVKMETNVTEINKDVTMNGDKTEKSSGKFTGLVEIDGTMYYYVNGSRAQNLCGVVIYEGERWFISHGMVDFEYKGPVCLEDKMWNVENGKVGGLYSGLAEVDGVRRYYIEGISSQDYNGIVSFEGEKWIVSRGVVDTGYEGTIYIDNVMLSVDNGKIVGVYTGLAEQGGVMRYYEDGIWEQGFSGVVDDGQKEWYVLDGTVDVAYTGAWVDSEKDVCVIKNGEVVSHFLKEEMMKEYYVERESVWLQMKYEMLLVLENKKYVSLDENVYEIDMVGQAIDSMKMNPIVAESLKDAIQAAIQDETIEEIVESAMTGAVEGGLSYLDDTLKEKISTSVFGFNIFAGIEKVNRIGELFDLEDTPTVMVNALIEDQESDILTLLGIISKEKVEIEDVYQAVSLFQKITARDSMLASVTEGSSKADSKVVFDDFTKWVKDYALWNQKLIEMNGCGDYKAEEISLERVNALGDEIKQIDTRDIQLYNASFIPIITEYDLDGFSSVVKAKNGAAVLGKETLGGLMGSLMEMGNEDWLNTTQKRHKEYFRQLVEAQEDSYHELLEAKAAYDSKIGLCISMRDEDASELIKYFEILSAENKDWESEREYLIKCIAAYKCDLNYVYMFYQYTHSGDGLGYGAVISQEVRKLEDLLSVCEYTYDLEEEEQNEVYYSLLNDYVLLVEENISTTGTPMFETVTDKYGDGNGFRRVYRNGNHIQVIKKSNSLTYENPSIWMYDSVGQPLYVKVEDTVVYFKEGEPIKYSCSESYAQQLRGYAEYMHKSSR